MERSSESLSYISKLVLDHIDSRDPVGGQSWKTIYPLEDAEHDVGRKYRLVSHVIRNEDIPRNLEILRDNLLDLLGYIYILYWKIDHYTDKK